MTDKNDRSPDYSESSLTVKGAVALGTGVMIGAGIFALTGQIAEMARQWFLFAFAGGAVVSVFSGYSYAKLASAYPSAGGIAMFLEKAYGKGLMTGACALLMYFSMVINESLVARTFGTYTLQLFGDSQSGWLTPALGVGLLLFAFFVNIQSNRSIERFSIVMALIKITGILVLAAGGLWVSGLSFKSVSMSPGDTDPVGFIGAVAMAILAYKGFTTITNSGSELENPRKNVGRAIFISIGLCLVLYSLVALAVGANLTIDKIVEAKDYALAEAARPSFGQYGVWFTVLFAIVATVSGIIASAFAVSRMLAMLTEMDLVPHRHFKMPGDIQTHTLVYTIVFAMILTVFFDLSRIASLGAVFYLVMDMAVHWGVLRHLRQETHANTIVVTTALVLDTVVLAAFIYIKAQQDALIIILSLAGIALIFGGEKVFLHSTASEES